MLTKRVVVRLELRGGSMAEGGDPADLAARYEAEGADEIVLVDVAPSLESRRSFLDVVQRTAERLFIPLTVGGAVQEIDDIARALRSGADKVSINASLVRRPELLTEAAGMFGSHSIVAAIEARKERRALEMALREQSVTAPAPVEPDDEWYRVFTADDGAATALDAIEWAAKCASLGAGEILISSIDHREAGTGYDLELTARVVEAVRVPVIASGGASAPEQLRDAFVLAGADAAVASHDFHRRIGIAGLKRFLAEAGVPVRTEDTARPLERLATPD